LIIVHRREEGTDTRPPEEASWFAGTENAEVAFITGLVPSGTRVKRSPGMPKTNPGNLPVPGTPKILKAPDATGVGDAAKDSCGGIERELEAGTVLAGRSDRWPTTPHPKTSVQIKRREIFKGIQTRITDSYSASGRGTTQRRVFFKSVQQFVAKDAQKIATRFFPRRRIAFESKSMPSLSARSHRY
jgi:hypothetical protein